MSTDWTDGDVSGSATLTDDDHLFPGHTNELRTEVDARETDLTTHEADTTTHGVTGAIADAADLTTHETDTSTHGATTVADAADLTTHEADTTTHGATGAVVGTTNTQTQTNKRITKRVTTITSHATPTINTDNCDAVTITAQGEAITSMTTNLSGTPTNFQTLIIRILDDGTGRAITWGTSFQAMGIALPTTTTASKVLTAGFIYDTVDSKWGCVAVSDEV